MTSFEINLEDAGHSELAAFINDRIYEFNVSATGISDGQLMAFTVRDTESEIIAALSGHTWGGTCEIVTLWVAEQYRNQGIGTRLLKAAESEALQRQCGQLVVATHSFQAPDFYSRFGFETCGAVEDYPSGHQSIFMRKVL